MIEIFLPAIAVALLTLKKVRFGLAAVFLLIPAYVWRTHLGPIPTTALELSIVAMALAAFLKWSRDRVLSCRMAAVWKNNPLRWPLLVFAAAALAGVFVSPDLRPSLGAYRAWVVEPMLVAALGLAACHKKKHWADLVLALGLGGAAVSFYGLAEYFLTPAHLTDGRLNSIFIPANYHAMLTVPLMLLLLPQLFKPERTKQYGLAAGSVAIMAVALYFTYSFGGYLALGAGTLAIVLVLARKKWRWRLIMAGLAVAAAVVASQFHTFKLWNAFNFNSRSSSSVRVQIWRTSVELIKEHPLAGVGYGDFERAYRATVPKLFWPPLEWLVSQPHNLYLALWTETGIIGLAAFVWLVIAAFRILRRAVSFGEPLATGAWAALIATLVHGLVDTPLFKNDLAVIFFILIALSIFSWRQSRQNAAQVIK